MDEWETVQVRPWLHNGGFDIILRQMEQCFDGEKVSFNLENKPRNDWKY